MMYGQMTYGRRDNARIVKVNQCGCFYDGFNVYRVPSNVYRVPSTVYRITLRHSKGEGDYCLLHLQ